MGDSGDLNGIGDIDLPDVNNDDADEEEEDEEEDEDVDEEDEVDEEGEGGERTGDRRRSRPWRSLGSESGSSGEGEGRFRPIWGRGRWAEGRMV